MAAGILSGSFSYAQVDDKPAQQKSQTDQTKPDPVLPTSSEGKQQGATKDQGRCDNPEADNGPDICAQWAAANAARKSADLAQSSLNWTVASFVALVLTLFASAWAARAAAQAAQTAERSVAIADETAKRQLRAYVSLDQFNASPKVDKNENIVAWEISVIWRNTGATPTFKMVTHVSVTLRDSELESNYPFQDLWIKGRKQIYSNTSLSPNAIISDLSFPVGLFQLHQISREEQYMYIYGWADYNDIFPDTPRHRTEFCARLLVVGDPAKPSTENLKFDIYWKHNGTDTECVRKPRDSNVLTKANQQRLV